MVAMLIVLITECWKVQRWQDIQLHDSNIHLCDIQTRFYESQLFSKFKVFAEGVKCLK